MKQDHDAALFARGLATLRRHEPNPMPGTIGLPYWQVAEMQWEAARDPAMRSAAWDTLLRGQAEHVPAASMVRTGLGQAPAGRPWGAIGLGAALVLLGYWLFGTRERRAVVGPDHKAYVHVAHPRRGESAVLGPYGLEEGLDEADRWRRMGYRVRLEQRPVQAKPNGRSARSARNKP